METCERLFWAKLKTWQKVSVSSVSVNSWGFSRPEVRDLWGNSSCGIASGEVGAGFFQWPLLSCFSFPLLHHRRAGAGGGAGWSLGALGAVISTVWGDLCHVRWLPRCEVTAAVWGDGVRLLTRCEVTSAVWGGGVRWLTRCEVTSAVWGDRRLTHAPRGHTPPPCPAPCCRAGPQLGLEGTAAPQVWPDHVRVPSSAGPALWPERFTDLPTCHFPSAPAPAAAQGLLGPCLFSRGGRAWNQRGAPCLLIPGSWDPAS